MTISLTDIADTLRWLWLAIGLGWIGYAWFHRVPYLRTLLGLVGLVALDWVLHAFADFAEQPGSTIPSDFSIYSVMMLLAALVGLGVAYLYARWRKVDGLAVLEAAVVAVAVGGVAGRAYQVWTNWEYYSENTDLIADLSQGGFGIQAALVAGLLALVIFCMITRNPLRKLADSGALGLAIAQSIGWYGASLTHVHYGVALDAPVPDGIFAPLAHAVRTFGYNAVQDLPDAYNLIAFRIPVQMISSLFFLGLFIVLLVVARSRSMQSGLLLTLYLLVSATANFLFGFWRGDETLVWNGLRVDQWIEIGLIVIGLALVSGHYVSGLQRRRVNVSQRRTLQHA